MTALTASAFREVVGEVADPVRRYLLRRTDPATADEVLAETLVVLWRGSDRIPDARIAWAIGVARLQLQNAERATRRRERLRARAEAEPHHEIGDDHGDRLDRAASVRAVLAQLREGDRELIRLALWDELPAAEIALVLGISANAVAIRLHRARRRFAELWRKAEAAAGQDEVKEVDR